MKSVCQRKAQVGLRVSVFLVVCTLCMGMLFAVTKTFACADESENDNSVNVQQLPDSSFIYDTTIADLALATSYYDNQTVQVTGEVVGDSIKENIFGRYRWITLSSPDHSSTISVYMSGESAAKIDTFGAYDAKGTTLQVRGIFHLTCPEHEGLSDLHAEVVTVVKPGKHIEDPLNFEMFIPGIIVVAIGLVMIGIFYWLRERQR